MNTKINKSTFFCNNCGKQGHSFNQCKKPITSIGIVAIKYIDEKFKYLMICRKDSLGYIDFLRGKYPLYDKKYISNLIYEMTNVEKHKLLNTSFDELWRDLWGDFVGLNYKKENHVSRDKFLQIQRGIQIDDKNEFNLKQLIKDSKSNWETPEWGFPKGRRNNGENDIQCALREWEEETGYEKKNIQLIKNILPMEEIFMGSNYKSYKHKYYLGYMENAISPKFEFQKSEVSMVKWCTLDEAVNNIRTYNLEKIELIKKVDSVLNKYRLIL
jgi:8-oxo-dGTP pyrophosphatase MutT (NUDIX family)